MAAMGPDKVKTITSVMKPLLGRGDNERIFSRNLVSINHVDHHCEPAHRSDVLPDSVDSFFTRLVSQDSARSLVCSKESAPPRPPRVLCWSWRSNQFNVTLPTQVKIPWTRPQARQRHSSRINIEKRGQVHLKSANWLEMNGLCHF